MKCSAFFKMKFLIADDFLSLCADVLQAGLKGYQASHREAFANSHPVRQNRGAEPTFLLILIAIALFEAARIKGGRITKDVSVMS